MRPFARLLALCAVSGIVYTTVAEDTVGPVESPKARDLYYHPEKVKEILPGWHADDELTVTALRYQIQLLRPGVDVATVTDKYDFRVGDQFRILVEVPTDLYVYVVHQSTDGRGTLLFPDPRSNDDSAKLPAHTQCVLPPIGWYGFTQEGGSEQILLFASKEPIKALSLPPYFDMGPNMWLAARGDIVLAHAKSAEAGNTRDFVYVYDGLKINPHPVRPPDDPNVPVYKIRPKFGEKYTPSGKIAPKKHKGEKEQPADSPPPPNSDQSHLFRDDSSPFRLASFVPQDQSVAQATTQPAERKSPDAEGAADSGRAPSDDRATPPPGSPTTFFATVTTDKDVYVMHRLFLRFR